MERFFKKKKKKKKMLEVVFLLLHSRDQHLSALLYSQKKQEGKKKKKKNLQKNNMSCFSKRENRIITMIALTALYFVVELVVGNITNCLALTADAFHVMSDCLALFITLVAIKVKDRGEDDEYTFGWRRAELVGGLVNSVFLLALLFTVCVDSIKRFFYPEEITNPEVLIATASAGLLINIVGLVVFREHAHIGGNCSHSHGDTTVHTDTANGGHSHGHSHSHGMKCSSHGGSLEDSTLHQDMPIGMCLEEDTAGEPDVEYGEITPTSPRKKLKVSKEGAMNHKALYLHMIGDALASVGVIIGVVIMWKAEGWEGRHIVDPILSLLISALLLKAVIPLIVKTVKIMLQGTSEGVCLATLRESVAKVEGVTHIEHLTTWQLTDTQNVGECKVKISPEADVFAVLDLVEKEMKTHNVQHATVQPIRA